MLARISIFVLIVVADQLTKHAILQHFRLGEIYTVIPDFFNLTLVYNPGAAFGMFGGLSDGWRRVMIGSVSLVALIVVCRFMMYEARRDAISQFALVGILAGAVGNIIDRSRFDSVVDFLDFYWGRYHWPAFNVADSAISIGVCVLMLRMLLGHHETELHTPPQADSTPVDLPEKPGITG